MEKPAPTAHPIHPLLAARWSPRAYDDARPVAPADLEALLEAARWAPSASNSQPWRFVVWDRARHPEAFARAFACLAEGNQAWVARAPVLIGVFADTLNAKGEPLGTAAYDTGAAGLSLCLEAQARGLAAHPMGGFNKQRLSESFGVPAQVQPITMVAVGYPASPDVLNDLLKARELAPRERRALAEIAFEGGWPR